MLDGGLYHGRKGRSRSIYTTDMSTAAPGPTARLGIAGDSKAGIGVCQTQLKAHRPGRPDTGGDSSAGGAVADAFVKEGAKVAIVYYDEDQDALEAAERIRQLGGQYLLL